MQGLLNPKPSEIRQSFGMVFVVYLAGIIAVLFFSKSVFGRGLKPPS